MAKEVSSFCDKYSIVIPYMNDAFVAQAKSRRKAPLVTNLHHFENELFKTVVDWMLRELNNKFDEANTELLLGMTCLNLVDSFSSFNEEKLKKVIRLAELYPSDFSKTDCVVLENQLKTFIMDMQSNIQFNGIKGIGKLATRLVEMKKHVVYPLVYQLIKLVLVFSVSTASIERAFSAMKIVKTRLHNKSGDQWMNDCLFTFIEKDVFRGVDNELILKRFQNMKSRRDQLPKKI